MPQHSSALYGCSSITLSDWERDFFRDHRPWGFILFGRNIDNKEQLRRLTDDLRTATDDPDALIFIDQEGGDVARLKEPHFRHPPAPLSFTTLYADDPEVAEEAAWLNARIMADEMKAVGINANCAPMIDVVRQDAHSFLQRRSLGSDPETATNLRKATALGLRDGGVAPVIKHAPGHGAALKDSHFDLPTVDLSRDELETVDFHPFRHLLKEPMMMTAHVHYPSLDDKKPATLSSTILNDIIRSDWSYDGLLISDDISMKALGGDMQERCRSALDAGVEIICHCNGDPKEMDAVAKAAKVVEGTTKERADRARAIGFGGGKPFDQAGAEERLRSLGLYEAPLA